MGFKNSQEEETESSLETNESIRNGGRKFRKQTIVPKKSSDNLENVQISQSFFDVTIFQGPKNRQSIIAKNGVRMDIETPVVYWLRT